MRIMIAAVGRLKDGSEKDLFVRYAERLRAIGPSVGLNAVDHAELSEGRGSDTTGRKADEAQRLIAKAGASAVLVALDEAGKAFSSQMLARWIGETRDAGCKDLAFLIGGPDGHGPAALARARLCVSLGAITLPHGLARIVLAEQLYRAATILAGHPYHRD